MITKNCNNPRCFINGQHNEGACQCEVNIDNLTDGAILALVEDNNISADTFEEAKAKVERIKKWALQDRVYRSINVFMSKFRPKTQA